MDSFWQEFINSFDSSSLSLFGIVLGILVVGWLSARVLKSLILRLMLRTRLDDKLAVWLGQDDPKALNAATALGGSRLIKLLTIALALHFAVVALPG